MKKFVLLICLLLALTAAACDSGGSKSDKKESTSKSTEKETKEKKKDPLEQLANSFTNLGKVKSFRSKTTMSNTDIQVMTEFEAPDRFHIITGEGTPQEVETYMIGNSYYIKMGDQWQKMEIPESPQVNAADADELQEGLNAAVTKEYVGTENLNGTPTRVFEYKTTVTEPSKMTYTTKIWIGTADGLPRRIQITYDDGANNGLTSTVDYYDYNADINIEPPIE